MCEELGFEKLLGEEGFFARLFGRSPSGVGRDPLYGPDLPVVLLTGGPGMGKGRLLRAVRDRFATKVPVICLDCGSPAYADRAEPEPGARSAPTEALVEAARRLHTWQGTGGSFAFPRLFSGLAMIATGVAEGTPEAVATEIERYEELAQKPGLLGLRGRDFWSGVFVGTIRNLLTTLSGEQLGPYSAAVSNALLDALFARLGAPGQGGTGADLRRVPRRGRSAQARTAQPRRRLPGRAATRASWRRASSSGRCARTWRRPTPRRPAGCAGSAARGCCWITPRRRWGRGC